MKANKLNKVALNPIDAGLSFVATHLEGEIKYVKYLFIVFMGFSIKIAVKFQPPT